jgi:HK97 family phage major capsid protein
MRAPVERRKEIAMTEAEKALFDKILKATGSMVKAQEAIAQRLQKIEDDATARRALVAGEPVPVAAPEGGERGAGFVAPEEGATPEGRGYTGEPSYFETGIKKWEPGKFVRDKADIEKNGAVDPCAFMRMVVFGKYYGVDRAARMHTKQGTWDRKCADYTLEQTMRQTERRDAAIGTGPAGGFIAPEEWQVQMIELLRARLIAQAAGVEFMPGQTSAVVRIPRMSAGGTGYWVGENAAITASQQTYQQLTLTPKIAAGITFASNQFIAYSNPQAAAVIQRDLVATLQRLIDLAIFRGSGVGDQPTGIANTTGITDVEFGANGAAPTQILLEKMRLALHNANSLEQRVAWATPPMGESSIRSILDSNNRPIYIEQNTGIMEQGPNPGRLFSWPLHHSTQLPTNLTKGGSTDCYEIFLCDFAEIFAPMWGGMEVAATGETTTAFQNLQTWIRVKQELDVGVRHPAACIYVNDARPAAGLT